MTCLTPRTVGFKPDGKTICWSLLKASKEYPTFQLPCGKCIKCRLEYARSWAVRCVHEAQMHENNCFITLTYSDENLKSPKLNYEDFQLFMKRLRKRTPKKLGMFVTGEYGENTKRPHWHAIIFNWQPPDLIYKYSNDRGDKVYSSDTLSALWPYGISESGSVTFESAGYVARYAAKKLVHGNDKEHEYHPISKKSSKQAIGKAWLEKYYQDVFNYGEVILHDGTKTTIPRYYDKWFQKHYPDQYLDYVINVKNKKSQKAEIKQAQENENWWSNFRDRMSQGRKAPIANNKVQDKIITARFKRLQSYLKGDI